MKDEPFPIADKQDFNAWRRQNPNAYTMLDAVIFAWRGSSARTRKHPGRFAAYSQLEWSEKSGLSRAQTKRALKRLEIDGLIIRVDATFAGSTRCSFYQPTELALRHKGRPGDPARLKKDFEASEKAANSGPAPLSAPQPAPLPAPLVEPLPAPFITSLPFPSTSSIPQSFKQTDSGKSNKEEKGRAGKKVKLKIKMKKPIPANEDKPQPSVKEADSIEAGLKEIKQKKLAKLLAQFPVISGPHEKDVKHPHKMHGDKWATYSLPIITKTYAKYVEYVEYVDNWYGGKKGEGYKLHSYAEVDETALDAELAASIAQWDQEIEDSDAA